MATLRIDSLHFNSGVMDMPDEKEYVSIQVAADILGVHRETVSRMIRRGDLPAELIIENGRAKYRILRSDLDNVKINPPHRPPSSNDTVTF